MKEPTVEEKEKMKIALTSVISALAKLPFDEPKFYYKFPENRADFNLTDMFMWFREMEDYSKIAEYWEKQERGAACHVDRAGRNWVAPKLKEFLEYMNKK